jgi:hypothetical protein
MTSRIADGIVAPRVRDEIDVTSEDSFPASDPPSWTPVVRTGTPYRGVQPDGMNTDLVPGTRGRTGLGELLVPARAVRREAGRLAPRTRDEYPVPGPAECSGTSREEG